MSLLFVRDAMLSQQTPPLKEKGAVKWMRENLFSGWMNTILTVLGVLALYFIVKAALPWLLHGVWNAKSLGECRDIIAANWGEGQSGACWALIHERWNQFLFGFYPRGLYWRPVLAFALLFVAIAPVLFSDNRQSRMALLSGVSIAVLLAIYGIGGDLWLILSLALAMVAVLAAAWFAPATLLWVTGIYPALAFWLLWGGSVWAPVMTMLGFAIIGIVYRLVSGRLGTSMAAAVGFIAACLWWLVVQGHVSSALEQAVPFSLTKIDSDQFGGFLLAFAIGVTAIVASLPLGIVLALGRKSDMPLVKMLCVGFIEFIRGVPLITMLFTASLLLQYFLPRGTNFDLILRVDILVTLFASAYIAEVIRGGLAALPRGQSEAADALGLDYWQAQRLIIMPQALKISIPGIVSSFIGLFKDTTLVAFVGLLDPLKGITAVVRADINWKGIYWEPYIFVGAIFFVICFSMSRYSMYLERKLKRDHH